MAQYNFKLIRIASNHISNQQNFAQRDSSILMLVDFKLKLPLSFRSNIETQEPA